MKTASNNPVIFINGELVDLSPLDPDGNLEEYVSWMNDQEITRYMETGCRTTTRKSLIEYIKRYNSSQDLLLGIIPKATGQHIGNITLHMFDLQNRTAEIGIVIGNDQAHGQGYATEAIRLVLAHGFQKLNLHKIYAGMVAENTASVRVFEKAGFVREGVLRQHFFLDGCYIDCYRYGILVDEFNQ